MNEPSFQEKIIALRFQGEGMENDGAYWTEADRRYLIEEYVNGMSISHLAINLHRSEGAIMQQMIQEGLVVTPEGKRRNRRPKTDPCCDSCKMIEDCAKLKSKCPKLKAIVEEK